MNDGSLTDEEFNVFFLERLIRVQATITSISMIFFDVNIYIYIYIYIYIHIYINNSLT